jgi:electron transport complex protein RnfC
MTIKTFSIGGIHPEENKLTHDIETKVAALPKQAIFPLSQHIGAPAKPVVAKGDKVKVGTLIAEAGGFVSAPIFSSVSGTVFKIDTAIDATGYRQPAIIINVEGDEWEESIDRSDKLETIEAHPELTPEEIVNRIKAAGVVGMGGACFPTFIKLTPPPTAKAECVIINAVECEPYITSDFRLMMEHADEILVGLELLMIGAKVTTGYIGIETNKMPAIELLTKKCAEKFNGKSIMVNGQSSAFNVSVVPLKQRYPQGGEKQLVDAVIRRQVPAPPAIPVNVGAIVQNVGTAFAVYEAVMKHKPLFERYTTVTGKRLANPGNFLVRMGTPMQELIDACGGMPEGDNKLLAGGPMMGKALTSTEVPICKGTNSVTIISDDEARRKTPQPCIRCAKCVGACPMGLEPYLLAKLSEVKNWERAEREDIVSCIECGSCQFTCPAHRPLLDNIRQGKSTVMGIIRSRAAK